MFVLFFLFHTLGPSIFFIKYFKFFLHFKREESFTAIILLFHPLSKDLFPSELIREATWGLQQHPGKPVLQVLSFQPGLPGHTSTPLCGSYMQAVLSLTMRLTCFQADILTVTIPVSEPACFSSWHSVKSEHLSRLVTNPSLFVKAITTNIADEISVFLVNIFLKVLLKCCLHQMLLTINLIHTYKGIKPWMSRN